jgi:hypothetical protein
MVLPLQRIDDGTSPKGGLLRASFEVVARLTVPTTSACPSEC